MTFVRNARLGYRFENGMRVALDAYNVFNAKAQQVAYVYESRLPQLGEPVGVADRHFHPVEPLSIRLTLAGNF